MARLAPKTEYDGSKPLRDPKQEFFCVLFTTNTLPSFWGNGQNSYEFAYGHWQRVEKIEEQIHQLLTLKVAPAKERKGKTLALIEREIEMHRGQIKRIHDTCRASAPRVLANVSVKKRNGYLLDNLASLSIVDRELVFAIQQRGDLDVKMRAIEHHDKRVGRIKESIEMKHEFIPIEGFNYVMPEGLAKSKKK